MSPGDLFWQLINFFAVPAMFALVAALSARAVWRRDLARWGWAQLTALCIAVAAAAQLLGLFAFGSDGSMAAYALMVSGVALTLWWAGRPR